jgi:hypothetical protein
VALVYRLSFYQEIPHHSTFSKKRHGRFQESKLFEQLFEQIVRQCMEVGLVRGEQSSVDGSFVEANAAKESRIPREQLAEAAEVHQTLRQYLRQVEAQNPVEEPVHEQDQVVKRGTILALPLHHGYASTCREKTRAASGTLARTRLWFRRDISCLRG